MWFGGWKLVICKTAKPWLALWFWPTVPYIILASHVYKTPWNFTTLLLPVSEWLSCCLRWGVLGQHLLLQLCKIETQTEKRWGEEDDSGPAGDHLGHAIGSFRLQRWGECLQHRVVVGHSPKTWLDLSIWQFRVSAKDIPKTWTTHIQMVMIPIYKKLDWNHCSAFM